MNMKKKRCLACGVEINEWQAVCFMCESAIKGYAGSSAKPLFLFFNPYAEAKEDDDIL